MIAALTQNEAIHGAAVYMSLTENLLEILARPAIGIFYLLTLVVSAPLFPAPYLWTFDSTFQDVASIFNATSKNNVTFSSTSITGYGASLSLSSPAQQSVYIASPRLALKRNWSRQFSSRELNWFTNSLKKRTDVYWI